MKFSCVRVNESSSYEYPEETCIKLFNNMQKNFLNLSNFKYDEIKAKFNILCRLHLNECESIEDQEETRVNFIQRKKKKDMFNFCSQVKNDIKKFIKKLPKKIKERNQKLLRIPKVLGNSINERKKKLSLSKNRIKRKSIAMIKAVFNNSNGQVLDQNTKMLTSKYTGHLHNLALKASALQIQPLEYIDESQTLSIKGSFKHFKFQAYDSNFCAAPVPNISTDATFLTVDTTFSGTENLHNSKMLCVNSKEYVWKKIQTQTTNLSTAIHDSWMTEDESESENLEKPLPEWAKSSNLTKKALSQAVSCVNFTNLFRAAFNTQINLGEVFKSNKCFHQRTSSADWQTYKLSEGINAEMSYMVNREQNL